MANEATAELYRRQSGLNKAKFTTDYEQYLADLATKYGISNDQLNANLESRGILRSGEAGTARTRLSAAEEAARTSARTNYDYNTATEDIDLATKLAGLMAGGSGGGSTTPAPVTSPVTPPVTPPVTEPVIERPVRGPGSPGNPNAVRPGTPARPERQPGSPGNPNATRPGTPAPPVRPVRDATPRPPVPATTAPRPGTTPSVAPVVTPVYGGGNTQGQLPQAPLPTTPALPDLSGVDWEALARMGTTRPVRDAAPRAPRPVTNMPRPGTTRITPPSARNR